MSTPPALIAQKLAFEISPIVLVGGVAQFIPGGMLPIISITEAVNFVTGLLSGSNLDLDSFFAHFAPMPGGKLIDIQTAKVPFANQAVAANAIIQQPLRISLKMTCPARGEAGFAAKTATMVALQATLRSHTSQGGTFTVATPSVFYDNCLLTGITDVSAGQPSQPQSIWQWDFERPLLTADQLAGAMNSMMSAISGGLPSSGALSGGALTIGSPLSMAGPSISPAIGGTAASGLGF